MTLATRKEQRGPICALVACACVALCLFALIVFLNTQVSVEPQRSLTDGLSNKQRMSGYMLLLSPILALWMMSVDRRCTDARIKTYIRIAVATMVGWLAIVIVNYRIDPFFDNYFWYAYYIGQLGIPLLMVLCVLRASSLENRPRWRVLRVGCIAISAALLAFVFTNDFHQTVFVFENGSTAPDADYTYGPGSVVVNAWRLLLVVFGFIIVANTCHKSRRSALPALMLIVAPGILYAILYIFSQFGHDVLGNSSFISCVFFTLAFELLLDFGFLPARRKQLQLFDQTPWDLRILDKGSNEQYSSEDSAPIDDETRGSIISAAQTVEPNTPSSVIPKNSAGTRYRLYALLCGTGIITEDISRLIRAKAQLEDLQAELESQRLTLERTQQINKRVLQQEAQMTWMAQIEESLSETVEQIRRLLEALPSEHDIERCEERASMLARIKLLVAYCKRKGMLMLIGRSPSQLVDDTEIRLSADEVSADLRSIGIPCAALVESNCRFSVSQTNTLYDCFYACVIEIWKLGTPVITYHIESCNGTPRLTMAIEHQAANHDGDSGERVTANVERRIAELGAICESDAEEDDYLYFKITVLSDGRKESHV